MHLILVLTEISVIFFFFPRHFHHDDSFEVMQFSAQNSPSGTDTSFTLNTAAPTGFGPEFSAAERAQPYRPLFVLTSIFLAAVIVSTTGILRI